MPPPGGELVAPTPLAALAVWLANDHVLKGSGWAPAVVTGKLSDVAGLFCFTLFAGAVVRLITRTNDGERARRQMRLAALATAAMFTSLELLPNWAALVARVWGPSWPDVTDLFALPAVGAAVLWHRRWVSRPEPPSPAHRRALVFGGVLIATAATSPTPRIVRPPPIWELTSQTRWENGCARLEAWIAKSGKTGVGVALQPDLRGLACSLELRAASVRIGHQQHAAAVAMPLALGVTRPTEYLPFVFDNDRAWRRGEHRAFLVLDLEASGAGAQRWELGLEQRLPPEAMDGRRAWRAVSAPVDAGARD